MTGPPRNPLSKEAFHAKLASTPVANLPKAEQVLEVTYKDGDVSFDGLPLAVRMGCGALVLIRTPYRERALGQHGQICRSPCYLGGAAECHLSSY